MIVLESKIDKIKGEYMFLGYSNEEFQRIIDPILRNEEFLKTKEKRHHGITRYDHLMRVSYYSYIITKVLHLNYQETTRAALLHDFFLDETESDSSVGALQNHPMYALANAKKYYDLTDREEDIIKTHMFPVTFKPPKYLESWIVDLVDDVAGVYEKYKSSCNELKAATTFLLIFFLNFIQK